VTNVVFAFKGQPAGGDQATQLVLRNLLGGDGSALKWGSDATASTVGKGVGSAVTGPFQLSAFAATFSDSGLVGVHLAVGNGEVKPAVTAAAEVRGGGVM
jgi:ubiquinol-cytochrome c reductase core subunit 2